ncbi:hypothetical protein BJY04DRAFT_48973 [Aspergillus karnatakaensis]|uniref:putative HIT finger domain protein n=1 Tax=Aspergillus karnatakaensis TaxID=1810916 RepID=UPI003CCD85AE
MYHVEVIPNSSTTHATPGWTYVAASRAFDPAKAAIAPSTGRKRGIRDPARTDVSSRQANAIVRHLAELDRENHKDVAIPIPVRQGGGQPRESATRGTRTKVTSNVRRILQSQKTFKNYLDDEEAALAQAASTVVNSSAGAQRLPVNKITKPSSISRRSSTPATTPKPAEAASRAKKDSLPQPSKPTDTTLLVPAAPAESSQSQPQPKPEQEPDEYTLIKSQHDNDPLLKSYIPPAPSERIMRALLAEPPLTYHASRAGPPITGKAARKFCCICGYWGKIRCRNCHQRTCGLECYKTHEDSRCGAFF